MSKEKKISDTPGQITSFPRPLRRIAIQSIIIAFAAILTFISCRWYYQSLPPSTPVLKLIHHHPNQPAKIHTKGGALDNCPMLRDCFPDGDSIYRDLPTCHQNMNHILKNYDSSVVIRDGQLAGFISFHLESNPDDPRSKAINIYNVCVNRQYRGQGIAKKMLQEGIEAMMDHYSLRDKKILLALDVDMTSSMAAESFTMYARLGFLRAWQTCRSVADVDWRPIFNNPKSTMVQSPIALILADMETYVNNDIRETNQSPHLISRTRTKKGLDHYCMFKFYGESWLTMGQALVAPYHAKRVEPTEK